MPSDSQRRDLPEELKSLEELSYDLRLAGSGMAERIWKMLDPDAWERLGNPHMIRQHAYQERLDELANNQELLAQLRIWLERRRRYLETPGWFRNQQSSS